VDEIPAVADASGTHLALSLSAGGTNRQAAGAIGLSATQKPSNWSLISWREAAGRTSNRPGGHQSKVNIAVKFHEVELAAVATP